MQSKNPLEVSMLIVVISQEGSFVRAAKKLGVPQSSLTRKVSSLEKNIGVRLFERKTSRKIELTKAGELFVQESTHSLSHAERAWNLARYQAKIESGPCRIGYSPYIHSAFLPFLSRFDSVSHAPTDENSGVVLESVTTLESIERVLRGRLHVGLGTGPVTDPDLWVQVVGREGFSICLPRNHRFAQKTTLTVLDLHGETIFWMPRSLHPRFYRHVVNYIRSVGAEPLFREVRGATHALEFVAHGFGIAMLPRSATRISYSGTVFRPLADRYIGIETVLFMRRDQRQGYLKELIDDLFFRLLALKIQVN